MSNKAIYNAWRYVSPILVALVPMLLAPIVGGADVGTKGEYTFSTSTNGGERLAVKVTFSCPNEKRFLQMDNHLYMPLPHVVTYTLDCQMPQYWSVYRITADGWSDHGKYINWTRFTTDSSFSVTADFAQAGQPSGPADFEGAYVTFLKQQPGWSPEYASVHVPMYVDRVGLRTWTAAPGNAGHYDYSGLSDFPDAPDNFNTTVHVYALQASPRGPDENDPAAGALVSAEYTDDQGLPLPWKGKAATADSNGMATVIFGSGAGSTLALAVESPASALYLSVMPTFSNGTRCEGYVPKTYLLPKFAALAGHLDVQVVDQDGYGLPAELMAWGGPFPLSFHEPHYPTKVAGTTGISGFKRLDINPDNLTEGLVDKAYTAKIAPRVDMELIYTQQIDFPANLVSAIPCYISPRFTLNPSAYTYANTDPRAAVKRCNGGRIEVIDDASGNVIREEPIEISLAQPDEIEVGKRRDRKFLPVEATREERVYRARVVFDDPDGQSTDGKLIASEELNYHIQATSEERKPDYSIEFVACAVGTWSGAGGRNVPSEALALQQETSQDMFPIPVTFGTGGIIYPSFWSWQNGCFATAELAKQLQEYQRASGADKVVGLVPPHWLDDILPGLSGWGTAAGVQVEGIDGAVLIDLAHISIAGAVHELLHSTGLLDVKEGDYLGVPDNAPPSANGYSTLRHTEVLNLMGKGTIHPRVMYEFCTPFPWLHNEEYYTLMNLLYKPAAKSFQPPGLVAEPKAVSGPRLRLHGYFNLNGNQAVLDPVFTDVGEPYNPYPSTAQSSNMFYVELLGAGQSQLGIYYIPVAPPKIHVSPAAGQTTPIADIPLDSRYCALFDFSVPVDPRLTAVRMGYVPQFGLPPAAWKTVNVSANAPVLQWVSAPTGTLSQPTEIVWTSTDADAGATGPAHAFYVSADGGGKWRQAANWIPPSATGGPNTYSYTFDSASWPTGSQYRFKVLASDGLRTSQLVTSQDVTVSGYDPNPKAELLIAKWEASRPETGFFTVLVPLRNSGHGDLEVWPDPATLPVWLSQTDLERTKIRSMGNGLLLLSGKQNTTGTFETTISLNTNDPATPTLMLPVKVIQEGPALAPRIARIELFPDYPDSRPWQPGEIVQLTLWDNDCRPTMEAFVTINQLSPAKAALVTDMPLEKGSLPGEYRADWTIPADAADGQYGLEFTLRDPAASSNTKDNARVLTVKRFTSTGGEGEGDTYVMVPNVEGQTQAAATATLTSQNLVVGTVTQECSDTVAAGSVINQTPGENQSLPAGGAVALTLSKGPFHVVVPNLQGMSQAAASDALSGAHLITGAASEQCSNTAEQGIVISQDPAPGISVPNGAAVALVTANGLCRAIVPNLVGMSQAAAADALGAIALVVGNVVQVCNDSVTQGNVVSQDPSSGDSVPNGYGVNLVVSTGPCNAKVPHLLGLKPAAAAVALSNAHLILGTVTEHCSSDFRAGDISFQNPAEETALSAGSAVSVTVSTGPCAGEGEVVPPTTLVAAQGLSNAFDTSDADHSGGLSLGEVHEQIPGLDAAIFNTLDANHDGQLTQAELQQYIGSNEGEGEGPSEGETPPAIAQTLNDHFTTADTDQSGGLSLAEAQARVPGLVASTFNTLDANQDGQLTQAELQQYLGTTPAGCACTSQKGSLDLKRRLGDLLLLGVSLMAMVLISRKVG